MSILEDVKIIVGKQLERDPSEFSETTDLEDEGFTSLDMVEVIFALEEKFAVSFKFNANAADAAERRTIGDIVEMVQQAIAKRDAG